MAEREQGLASNEEEQPRPALYSTKDAILLAKSASAASLRKEDKFALREAERRREQEEDDAGARSDADYAFLRRSHSDLPLQHLSRGQRQTAHEIEEEDAASAANSGRARVRSNAGGGGVGADGKDSAAAATAPGPRSASANRASDATLLSTIEYLESFLARSKRDLSLKQAASEAPAKWRTQLERFGGPEAIGRRAAVAELDAREAPSSAERKARSSSRGRVHYASPTVSSSRFSSPRRESPFAVGSGSASGSASARRPRSASRGRDELSSPSSPYAAVGPEEELALVRLESEVAALRRQARVLQLSQAHQAQAQAASNQESHVDAALAHIRRRADLERSVAYLEHYTQGRRPPPAERTEEQLWGSPSAANKHQRSKSRPQSASAATKLFSPSASPHTPSSRIPSSHPHKTGRGHTPSSCVYCARERDWRSFSSDALQAMQRAFPERAETLAGGDGEQGAGAQSQSRLRPLAQRMMETSLELGAEVAMGAGDSSLPISRDVDSHFLSQLSAAERRRQSQRLESLWYLVGGAERDRDRDRAALARLSEEVQAESLKRRAHMQWLEEQVLERCLRQTMLDKTAQRELHKAAQDQARQAQLLRDLKRQSRDNFTRDQIDLLKERQRIERDTDKMRMQNEKHSIREIQRQAREAAEATKQRKLDQIRHAEEKYAFKLSQLKRPAFAERGIDDLAHWKVGRPLDASL